ncbi:MAG: YceI family protein [Chitinophagales bacterium]|nr:YceI family protein [Chitinophagales bacterium]
MKKRKLTMVALAILTVLASCNNQPTEQTTETQTTAASGTYTIDAAASTVKWKGVMLGVKEHFGTVNLTQGILTVENGSVKEGSFTVDLNTITPTDANYDEKSGYGKEKLVAHLSSPDFFDVANFPSATFVIENVNGAEATGTLTVRGKSNTETVKNISVAEENGTVKATGTLTFDRKKYGVAFDMPMKDMVISNDIELTVELNGTKN